MPPHKSQAPDPGVKFPIEGFERTAYLKAVVTKPNIIVGDYSYYDDPAGPERFQDENVLYHFEGGGVLLRIGKFCALGTGTTFIMNGANHRMDGPSTYPFPAMGGAWAEAMDLLTDLPNRGDTVVGNDVWCGYKSLIMPGVTIGHGAIVAAGSVVVKDVPPYAIVSGNPARIVKMRYSDADIERLLAIAWWDWPTDVISANIRTLMAGRIEELEAVFHAL